MLAAGREVNLSRGDEPVALLLERAPVAFVREELLEGPDGEAALLDVGEDAPLEVVELRRRPVEAATARAVREEAVVQLVRRTDALALDRLRHPVRAVREHAIDAV